MRMESCATLSEMCILKLTENVLTNKYNSECLSLDVYGNREKIQNWGPFTETSKLNYI